VSERTIWKYPIRIDDEVVISMPSGAAILTVQVQNDEVCLWASVDPSARLERRRIAIYGTGNPVRAACYISTFQTHGGAGVWHAFDLGEEGGQ